MSYKAHNFPGFPRNPVYLPDWIPVEIKIIPSSVRGWTSGTKFTGQTQITWHDTGNSSSSASGEWNWAATGGRADINSPGSYNGIYDRHRIIICQRFDEIVGHSGTPAGNRSWAFEQAFGTGFDASIPVGVALFGGIIAAMGWSVETSLRKHQDWSGKWCPGQILNRNMWPQVQAMVADAARKAAAAAGGTVTPPQTYQPGDTVKATDTLNVRKGADTRFDVGFTLDAGMTATVTTDSTGQATFDGLDYRWVFIETDQGTGWVASDWLEVVKAAPAPAPAKQTVDFLVPMIVRTTPGFWDKANDKSNVVTTLPAGTKGTVLEGPKKEDGIDFYNVEIPGWGTGWVAKEIVNAIQVK